MAATGFLLEAPLIGKDEIVSALAGNICRCTGYTSIVRSLHNLTRKFSNLPSPGPKRIESLVAAAVLPEYFENAFAVLTEASALPTIPSTTQNRVPIGGGTDLFVQRPEELLRRDLSFVRRPLSATIARRDDASIHMDAWTTVAELQSNPAMRNLLPTLDEIAALIASPQIRERATVGGNFANASPIGDLSILFLALGADVAIRGSGEDRQIPLKDLFRGYKHLDLNPGELIEAVIIPQPGSGMKFNFEKVSRRTHMDIASVNTAMAVCTRDGKIVHGRISAGGVAPIPMVLERASGFVVGQPITADTAREAARIGSQEVAPIDDVRGSASYKRLLLKHLILAHFSRLLGIEVAG